MPAFEMVRQIELLQIAGIKDFAGSEHGKDGGKDHSGDSDNGAPFAAAFGDALILGFVAREMLQLANVGSMEDIFELFKETIGEFMESGLEAELEEELGYSKYDYRNKTTDNSRNGHSSKKLKTSYFHHAFTSFHQHAALSVSGADPRATDSASAYPGSSFVRPLISLC